MVQLKRTAINPLSPSGPPIVVIPRVSYQDAPSDLRRNVRHDAVERYYGSARQEEADEENDRLDKESDEEYGHNLSSDRDEDYEDDEEGENLVVDEGRGPENNERQRNRAKSSDSVEGWVQPQLQTQERPPWVRKPKSPSGEIIIVDLSPEGEPDGEQEEQQRRPVPQLRRIKAYKSVFRKDSLSEVMVDDSSSEKEEDVDMEDEPQPQRQAKPELKKKAPAKKLEIFKEEYDMENAEDKSKARSRKKALVSKASFFYDEDDEVPPTPIRKNGWPKGKKREPSLPILTEVDLEDVEEKPKAKPRKKTLASKAGLRYQEEDFQKPTPRARKKALVSRSGYTYDEQDIYEVPPTPKRKGGWPKGKKRGPFIQKQTELDVEIADEVDELQGGAKAKSKPRQNAVSNAVMEESDSHDETIEPQQKSKEKMKPSQKAPISKAKIQSEDDESDEPQRKTAPSRKVRNSDTPGTMVGLYLCR